jgi:molecular chaperone GrpE
MAVMSNDELNESNENKNDESANDVKSKDKKRVIEFGRSPKPVPSAPEFAPDPAENDTAETTQAGDTGAESGGNLAAQLARLKAEKDELMQTLVRRQADFENYRKRIERDRDEEQRRGVSRMISDLIPVLDAFERALKAHDDPAYEEYRKGLELIYKQLWDMLAKHGLERITAAGVTFDPHFHQAIERVDTREHPDGAILEVFQDGYMFHGRVLRPAIVRVAVHAGGPDDGADKDEPSLFRHRTN